VKRSSLICLLAIGCAQSAAEPTPDAAGIRPARPTPVENELFDRPTRLVATDGVIDTGPSWGHSGPWVEDVNGDGLRDLVVGDFSGLFHFYRNQGTNREPKYAAAVNLQAGGVDAKVPIY